MISYIDFKKLFDKLEIGSEIEIYFNNNETYMLVKSNKTFTLGKTKNGKIYEYDNLDKTLIKSKWNNIDDIVINFAFSVVNDKKKISEIYGY